MKIGKLNELLTASTCRVMFENSTLCPSAETEGDPLRGETLCYKWNTVRDEGVALHLSLGEPCFIDRAVLRIGEKTALRSAVLKAPTAAVLSAHRAETGKTITSHEIELEAGAITDSLSLVLTGDFSDIEILSVELYGFCGEESPIFPTPNAETLSGTILPAAHFTAYSADSDDGLRAGEILAEKFLEKTEHPIQKADTDGVIEFQTDASIAPDGYELSISEASTQIRASNLRGLIMGAETFIKLTTADGVRTASVSDAPFLTFRGVHLFLPSVKNLEFAQRLIKYLISPMGYNAVIMEIATGMQYESHPEINETVADALDKANRGIWPPFPHGSVADGTVLPKSVIREFVDYIRSFGIDVIPEVQSLGHVPYLTITYPEIAEVDPDERDQSIDTRAEDARPDKFYPHCYCPSSDRSYEILFDLIDEIVEVFRPKEYIHMGHDEVYYMGLCPRCKGKSHADLFAADINRIHAHLKKKGLKMMIWSDMLQPVTKYQTPAAIDMIPKDILCLDFIWYFHLDKDIENNLLEKGFTVALGNLYSSHFPRFESRIRKSGMIGGQISTWVSTREEALQQEGKFYDLFMTAEMLWSASYSHLCHLVYDRMIAKQMPLLRENLKGIRYPSLAKGAKAELLLENPIDFPPASHAEQTTELTIGQSYDSLILTHTMLRHLSRLPWAPHTVAARYVLRYADGSSEEIPVTVGGNIAHWNRRHDESFRHKLYRHNGYTACYETDGEEFKTENGENVTFYRYEHLLKEDTPLVSLSLSCDPAVDAKVFLKRIEGIKK